MPEYRGFISFSNHPAEFHAFKQRIDRYYNWCGALNVDPADDENYNAFCEAYSVFANG